MGNKTTKKQGITFPDPPQNLSRSQYIQRKKNAIQRDELVHFGRTAGEANMTCPYCGAEKAYLKFVIVGMGGAMGTDKMEHFDQCKALEKMWLKYDKEQQEAMDRWEQRVLRLGAVQAKLKKQTKLAEQAVVKN